MNRSKSPWWAWWNRAVGAMDAGTGLLLMVAPEFTLRLMRVPLPHPAAMAFVSWIGAFVTAVGCAYFLAPGQIAEAADRARLATVWRFTTVVRGLVAAFVVWRVIDRTLVPEWLTVALADALIAAVQFRGLCKGVAGSGDET